MSPVSPVFHTEVTVSIGLKTSFRVGTSIPQIYMFMIVNRVLNFSFYIAGAIQQPYQTGLFLSENMQFVCLFVSVIVYSFS